MFTRRDFLRDGALAIMSGSLPNLFAHAPHDTGAYKGRTKRLVVIFQRGGADGLNMVVPHGEASYYAMRPTIHIPRKAVLDLDGFFGLHPTMAPLQPVWREKHLAIVHAVGSPHPTRSHFMAQDFIESGMPGVKDTEDGWLNRALHKLPADKSAVGKRTFRAIGTGHVLPRILSGREPAAAVNDIVNLAAGGTTPPIAQGANFPAGRFADSLKQLAQTMKANPAVQFVFAELGGWDHHAAQGSTQGPLAEILREFAQSLAAYWIDLGDLAEDTVIVTMSEFGRTARENSKGGTDHGHGGVMFVLGGRVRGGKVYGRWPGLEQSQLYEGRDLEVTTDFRTVLGEVVAGHLGNKDLNGVFPGFEVPQAAFLKLVA